MARSSLPTSSVGRLARLGLLAGRVGASLAANRARALASGQNSDAQERERLDVLVRNAVRVVETLGELKGAAMKLGQMLSLHEGLLPPEVMEALRDLQRDAPPIPFEVLQEELDERLQHHRTLFRSIEPDAFAAASIGQVHRGVLHDGRLVAIKIQYPEIGRVVRADLANLRRILGRLFALVSKADFDPVWTEVRSRLLEELDYRQEADNLRRYREIYAAHPHIVIPEVIDEASTQTILTMEFVAGLSHEEACGEKTPAEVRTAWGRTLFELALAGLFEHRILHADPNLANFGFREDGSVVVYDLGCVKRVPLALSRSYARLVLAVGEERDDEIPRLLAEMGVARADGSPVPRTMTDPYAALFRTFVREDPPYDFGADTSLYQTLIDLGLDNIGDAGSLVFPEHVVFINRTLGGLLGNLARLRAKGPWRDLVLGKARDALLLAQGNPDGA